jgi:hypothetical protein
MATKSCPAKYAAKLSVLGEEILFFFFGGAFAAVIQSCPVSYPAIKIPVFKYFC